VNGRIGIATCAPGANSRALKRGRRLPYLLLLLAVALGAAVIQENSGMRCPTSAPRPTAHWAKLYGALPLGFEANRGQSDPAVNFLARGQGYALFLTGHEAVLTLRGAAKDKVPSAVAPATLRLKLDGANAHAIARGVDELPGKANYFLGNVPSQWHTDVPTYGKVKYESVYPGVDLVYYGTQRGELEYDFVVAPGADPGAIALDLRADEPGSSKTAIGSRRKAEDQARVRITDSGDLLIPTSDGEVRLHKPVIYQPVNRQSTAGNRKSVDGRFALDAENHVRFALGPYDHSQPLVIDPVLVYATYIGGSGGDVGYAIAVDSNQDAYIAGVTNSTNYPTSNAAQSANKGNGDGFITKMNSDGTALIYSTYLGGSQTDTIAALALASSGSIFVTGYTASSDFPIKAPTGTSSNPQPFQPTYGGGTDAFVTQLSTDGKSIVYSSYLGGSGLDEGLGITVDASGNAYVTGMTQSADFPKAGTPLQATLGASQNNAFVSEVDFTGETLVYSTYLGGPATVSAQGIQIDSSGNAYVAGYVLSGAFPTTGGSAQPNAGGGTADAFVAKLNAGGSSLAYATYLGGSGDDRAYGIGLDSSLNVYITGATTSTNFPVTSGVFQSTLRGSSNAFVSKLNAAGSAFTYSTYLGGTGIDQGTAIAVVSSGAAYVTGWTESTDFPTSNPVQSVLGISNNNYCGSTPCADAFLSEFSADGTALTFSTYLGGNGPDFAQGVAVDSNGSPYITGSTSSNNFPVTSPPNSNATYVAPYRTTLTGTAGNAFIAKVNSGNNPNISLTPGTLNFGNVTVSVTSGLQAVTVVNASTVPLTITSIAFDAIGTYTSLYAETDNCIGTLAANGASCTINVSFTPAYTGAANTKMVITDDAGGTAGTTQWVLVNGSGVTAATAVAVQPTALSFTSQAVGTISQPQNVTITNTGTSTLNISKISTGTSSDFSQTNTCGALQNSLAVNQSCSISVSFSPTASGTRSASLSISDNATGSPQVVTLTGTGTAAFSITAPTSSVTVNPVLIGSTQTTFLIEAVASNFNNAITLSCPSSSVTCSFATNPIFAGHTTTLTVSNLTSNLANPYPINVTGTSGSQSNTLQLNLEFEDFTLSTTPTLRTINAGSPASYQIVINPLYGFNSQIQLQCVKNTLPPASGNGCSFSNATPTPNGSSPTSVTLTIPTEKYVAPTTKLPPRFPGNGLPPLLFGVLCFAGLAWLAWGDRRRSRQGWLGTFFFGLRLAALSVILALNLAFVACRPNTLVVTGTTTGSYQITVQGLLVSNTAVVRSTTANLYVTASPIP